VATKFFLIVVALAFQGCSLWFRSLESDTNPTCKEMRRTCAEYERLRETLDGMETEAVRQARETCNQYTYSCGQAVQSN
jgi:hypothetical protein